MKTETKYFGEIEYVDEDILVFDRGLFGFEEERAFLLLPFSGSDKTLLCLQSLATPGLAFVVMDPFALHAAYAPVLQPDELKALGVESSRDLYYYVLCVVKNVVAQSTVNMKCPVAINGETRRAMQVILEDDTYGMRHLLSEFGEREASESC